jgi:hypothetical protein
MGNDQPVEVDGSGSSNSWTLTPVTWGVTSRWLFFMPMSADWRPESMLPTTIRDWRRILLGADRARRLRTANWPLCGMMICIFETRIMTADRGTPSSTPGGRGFQHSTKE